MKSIGLSWDVIFRENGVDAPKELDYPHFRRTFTEKVDLGLEEYQLVMLFSMLDTNKDNAVSPQEFEVFFKEHASKDIEEKAETKRNQDNLASLLASNIANKSEFFKQANVNEEDIEKTYQDFLQRIKVSSDDYFMGNPTMFTDPMKCLKVCENYLQEIKDKDMKFFVDPTFGPTSKDLSGYSSIAFGEGDGQLPRKEKVRWMRPYQISPDVPPKFFNESGVGSKDVQQGAIGNCWFVSALSVVATKKSLLRGVISEKFMKQPTETLGDEEASGLLKGVYPPLFHFLREYGIYVMRFFKNSHWIYVIIDDNLPTHESNGSLLFGRSPQDELFWVALVEKAYAKVHRCYQSLISGQIQEGISDMSGFISETMLIRNENGFNTKEMKSPDELWKKIFTAYKNGSMMGCSIIDNKPKVPGEPFESKLDNGLVMSHAYSIQGIYELKLSSGELVRLVRVRNPWGCTEWTGKWSDNSYEMLKFNKE